MPGPRLPTEISTISVGRGLSGQRRLVGWTTTPIEMDCEEADVRTRKMIAAMIYVALAGCATTGTPSGNEEIVRGMYDAFARGDGAAVIGALDPQVRWSEADNIAYADRNPYVGPQAVAEGVFGRIMLEWSGFQVRPQEFIAEGDKVVVLGRYGGTYIATGRPLDAQFVHVWTIGSERKVTAFQQYADTEQFARVMGR